MSIYLRVRIRLSTLWAAIRALKEQSKQAHDEARLEKGPASDARRAEADHLEEAAREIQNAIDRSLDGKE